jgi:hypothetical protein
MKTRWLLQFDLLLVSFSAVGQRRERKRRERKTENIFPKKNTVGYEFLVITGSRKKRKGASLFFTLFFSLSFSLSPLPCPSPLGGAHKPPFPILRF